MQGTPSLRGNGRGDELCNEGVGDTDFHTIELDERVACKFVESDQIVASPELGPLADNGGPTQTQALLPGSPAIDSADDSACPATDQRGVSRPQGASCDVGAYEAEAP